MINSLELRNFIENAYLKYSMYVIMDRALPFIGDGLKPVQRRIMYAMSELGLTDNSKFKKSARTVGDVLGKYHPHSDSSCYEAMVLMAQPFSYRYPLIDGQGNWGVSDDPKSFAAMRYTESRLSKYSKILLDELDQKNVDWTLNFDGTLKEPKTLPARLPNILLNGSTGIAVGMATNIPTHNLREIATAIIMLIKKPNATLDDILNVIQGPDFPTEAEITTPRTEIKKIYQNGRGSIRMRATWKVEDNQIIITALPYQVSGSRILEQISSQMRSKKLPILENLRDESDHKNLTRLIIIPRTNHIDKNKIMSHLFATTDLEKSYRVNLNMIGLNGRPEVKNLLEILNEWLIYRRYTVKRRLKFHLDIILNRLHLLKGFLIAFSSMDEIINIIRNANKPKLILMSRFFMSESQATAILDWPLLKLTKQEEIKVRSEQKKLQKERDRMQTILASEKKMNSLLKKELSIDSITYGDDRRSPLYEREVAKTMSAHEMFPLELITIVLSQMGWIRIVKGHNIDAKQLNYKVGDSCKFIIKGQSNQLVVFIDSTGRSYSIDPISLSLSYGKEEPITGKLTLPPNATIDYMLMEHEKQKLFIISSTGYGFVCTFNDLASRNRSGKILISLKKNARIIQPLIIKNDDDMLLVVTKINRILIFSIDSLSFPYKGKSIKIISIASSELEIENDGVLYCYLLCKKSIITLYDKDKNKVKLLPEHWKKMIGKPGQRGIVVYGLRDIDQIKIKKH